MSSTRSRFPGRASLMIYCQLPRAASAHGDGILSDQLSHLAKVAGILRWGDVAAVRSARWVMDVDSVLGRGWPLTILEAEVLGRADHLEAGPILDPEGGEARSVNLGAQFGLAQPEDLLRRPRDRGLRFDLSPQIVHPGVLATEFGLNG